MNAPRPQRAGVRKIALAALTAVLPQAGPAAENEMEAFAAHNPSYFVIGHRHDVTTARFQLSFKYKLFDQDSVPAEWFPPLSGMHFAYTQTAIWDLSSNSKPFYDTSYRPALIWDWNRDGATGPWSAQAGFEHESNGKQGTDSRSINTLYVEPHWQTRFASDRYFIDLGVRLIDYLERGENADITDYRGHTTLLVKAGKPDDEQYRLAWRIGDRGGHYSLLFDASFPLRRKYFAYTNGYLYLQVFSGHGETLLDYNMRRPTQYRLGFAVSR